MKKTTLLMIMMSTFLICSYIAYTAINKYTPKHAKAAEALSIENTTNIQTKKSGITEKDSPETLEDDSLQISSKEKNLLARLVHAEAKGESFSGKVAVAEVVLNRVVHEEFPDTVKEVIYERNAFEPVQNGSIKQSADKESKKAVEEALEKENKNNVELLYFYNPETATSDWILTRKVVKKIGNHAFAI